MKIRASIIIRTKNEEEWIVPCINAIKKQSIKNTEIILVDNCSEDKTVKLAKSLGVKKIVKIKKYLPGKALNIGITKSNSDTVVILSAHCIPKNKYWLKNLISPLVQKNIVGVYGRQIPLPFTSTEDKRDLILTFGKEDKLQKKDYFFHNANSAINKKVWQKIKFDNKLTNIEDRDWGKKVISKDYNLYYSSEASVFHYHGLHQHERKLSFRASSVISIMQKLDIDEHGFPDELKINMENIPVFIPLKDNRYNKPMYKKILNIIIKSNKLKKVFIYGDIKHANYFKIPLLNRNKNNDKNKDLQIVIKNALREYEKVYKKIPRAIVYIAPSFINPIKGILKKSLKDFYLGGFSSIFPAYQDFGSYWIEEESIFQNIDTKKNPIDRGNPIYKACYGLGTIFRTSSIRKSSIFGNRIGVRKFFNLKNTLRD